VAANSAIVVWTDSKPLDVLRAYPVLDKPATRELVERLFPGTDIEEIGDQLLADALDPPAGVAYVGCFPGLDLVCGWSLMPDRPSQLDPATLGATERPHVYLYGVHADADWCTFGRWDDGQLVRALSVCPDPGIIEDVGEHESFEQPYWDAAELRPVALGEAALSGYFGIVFGDDKLDKTDPESIPVVGYKITDRTASPAAAP
jgi:hypothetical protein